MVAIHTRLARITLHSFICPSAHCIRADERTDVVTAYRRLPAYNKVLRDQVADQARAITIYA